MNSLHQTIVKKRYLFRDKNTFKLVYHVILPLHISFSFCVIQTLNFGRGPVNDSVMTNDGNLKLGFQEMRHNFTISNTSILTDSYVLKEKKINLKLVLNKKI